MVCGADLEDSNGGSEQIPGGNTGAASRWEMTEGTYRDDTSLFVIYFAESGAGAGGGTTTIVR